MTTPAPITLDDFEKRGDYYVRELGDTGWSEVVRADGFGFGSIANERIDELIEVDTANPAPDTGYRIQDIFQAAPDEDATQEVVVEGADQGAEEKPAPKARRARTTQ